MIAPGSLYRSSGYAASPSKALRPETQVMIGSRSYIRHHLSPADIRPHFLAIVNCAVGALDAAPAKSSHVRE
jgi:hypothetical protein